LHQRPAPSSSPASCTGAPPARPRGEFILSHLRQVLRAIREGANVRGYDHWSLVDNFEWADGWTLGVGLVAIDPHTQERTPGPSAGVYGAICRQNALP
jgi:beta-glucosidase